MADVTDELVARVAVANVTSRYVGAQLVAHPRLSLETFVHVCQIDKS